MADWISELKELAMSLVVGHGDYLPISNDIFRLIIKHGWHPVSEPPPDGGWYLVTYDCTYYGGQGIDTTMQEYNPLHFSGDHWGMLGVIAWMSLPEPFNSEQQ